jgi:hypothetical protein
LPAEWFCSVPEEGHCCRTGKSPFALLTNPAKAALSVKKSPFRRGFRLLKTAESMSKIHLSILAVKPKVALEGVNGNRNLLGSIRMLFADNAEKRRII